MGVFYDKNNNNYSSTISIDGVNIRLGSFEDKIEAAKVRNQFIIDYEIDGFNIQPLGIRNLESLYGRLYPYCNNPYIR